MTNVLQLQEVGDIRSSALSSYHEGKNETVTCKYRARPNFLPNIKIYLQVALCVLCNNLYRLRIWYFQLFLPKHDIQNAQVRFGQVTTIFN